MATTPEERLGWLARVQEGDDAAAREMVHAVGPLVLRIVRAHRPSRMAEEDLCQEVFLRIVSSLGQYQGKVPFERWVSRVAVHTCIDHLRRQRARPELRWSDLEPAEQEVVQNLVATASPSGDEHAEAAKELVGRLLEGLDPKDRLILQWLELEDRSVKEISEWTGWNANLVKVRAFRARSRLRRSLEALRKGNDHE